MSQCPGLTICICAQGSLVDGDQKAIFGVGCSVDQQTPATQPNQPWQESRYKCQSLCTAAPALSSAFYRAALTVHNCGIETFPLIAEKNLDEHGATSLVFFSLSSTPQFQNSDSGAIDFYRPQVSLGSGLWVSASLCPYVQDFWLKLCSCQFHQPTC